MGKVTNDQAIQGIYRQIREVLIQARSRVWQAVNTVWIAGRSFKI
ncbi:MAG: hypothetical protein U9N82_03555 [Thermodesulfobacteriota bacterium]|nr:hypothetical protein [Thermodesulfobacteriota bacterium]